MEKSNVFEKTNSAEQTEQPDDPIDLAPETLTFLKNHSDIADFFPKEELQTIRDFVSTLPPESQSLARRALILDFKQKLKETRKNSALAQAEIEKAIRENPNLFREELRNVLIEILTLHHLDSQFLNFRKTLDKFLKSRDDVRKTISRYKLSFEIRWQEELFHDLFGFYPKGKIVVEVLPASIYIRIFDIEDYVNAFITSTPGSNETRARSSGGAKFGIRFKNLPELEDKVMVENSSLTRLPSVSRQILSHEEEHSIFDYYNPELSRGRNLSVVSRLELRLRNTRGEISFDQLSDIINEWALSWVLNWEASAKDEILAYLKDGRDAYQILHILGDENGLYNYFQMHEDEFRQKISQFVSRHKISITGMPLKDVDISLLANQALLQGWHKYQKTLHVALLTVATLFKRYQSQLDNRLKIIRLLSQEPLDKWRRLEKILA